MTLEPHTPKDVNKPVHLDILNPGTDAVVAVLQDNLRELHLIREALSRRERPAPGLFDIPGDFPAKNRVRVETLVLMTTAAAVLTIRMGAQDWRVFPFAAADTKIIPLFVTIDRGIDMTLSTTAGSATGFFIGFPE